MEHRFLTAYEVAKMLRLPEERVYELARESLIPNVRIGRSVRFDRGQLEDWLANGGQTFSGGWKRNQH